MALWVRNNPQALCDSTELMVAEQLNRLSDEWVVGWGYYYTDQAGTRREGDFLVLGPDGGLLVLEVKSDVERRWAPTGQWENRSGANPVVQLDAEWKAVLNELKRHAGDRPVPWVEKALAVPREHVMPGIAEYHGVSRNLILSALEFSDFATTWNRLFARAAGRPDARARAVFLDTYARDRKPAAVTHFIDETDRVLMLHTEARFELLDQVADNKQLMVRGGTGTGKTWLALEQALRWAEQGTNGSSVLFLCYNLALTRFLAELVERARLRTGRPARGSVTVQAWEELARQLVQQAGLPYDVPRGVRERQEFYDRVLPQQLARLVQNGQVRPAYDALVVDEGQDHDTRSDGFPPDWQGPGWWGVYWRLLRDGARSRVAVFYDPAQRPRFRDAAAFGEEAMLEGLQGRPTQLKLTKTVRYTRPVFDFLKSLPGDGLRPLIESLSPASEVVEGPAVELHHASVDATAGAVEEIARRWTQQGLCRADDILILSRHSDLRKSALAGANGHVAGCPLVDVLKRRPGTIGRSSAYKAKGLDALAVIVVDYAPVERLSGPDLQIGFFIAASRARQLLAIVEQTD